jgi:23S rRNA (uracil1939-C5)-methyltransferase
MPTMPMIPMVPKVPKVPDVPIQLKITSMAYGGEGVGRWEGKAVFVPFAMAGEEIAAEIVEDRGRFARARLVQVTSPSQERVAPLCPHFGPDRCGGCSWQHIRYAAQLAFKAGIVRDQLTRIGRAVDPLVREPVGMDDPWRYRNHLQLVAGAGGLLAYQAAGSHRSITVTECPIAHPLAGNPHLEERLGGRTFRYSPRSFFQVNTAQAERLVDLVGRYVDPQGNETLLDCFCGVGVFGLRLAGRVKRVIGVEESGSSIADARVNAAGVTNATFLHGQAQSVLPSLSEPVHTVVLDPPREGCDPSVLKALANLAPRRIVYVSCDPSTLARDVGRLAEAGYVLCEVTPVDMFPQTYHIESVALMTKLV